MTNDDLYLVMHQIVTTITGLPGAKVVKAMQNAKASAPTGEYAAINPYLGTTQRGQANVNRSNTAPVSSPIGDVVDVQHDIKAQLVKPVSINFYRGNAHEYAAMLIQANKRPDISAILFQNSIGWRDLEGPQDLSALQSDQWEPRARVVINLWVTRQQSATVNAIYSAEIQAQNEDGDTLQTETTNVQG